MLRECLGKACPQAENTDARLQQVQYAEAPLFAALGLVVPVAACGGLLEEAGSAEVD